MDTKERVLDIRYVCMRSDFIAVTRALIRRPFWRTALTVVLSLIIAGHLFVMAWFWPVKEGVPTWYAELHFRYWPIWFLPLLLTVFSGHLAGLMAAMVFKTRAAANQDIVVTLSRDGVRARSADINSDISWSGIVKAIQTRTHLFLALSKREALILPRRGFASDADYAEAVCLVRAHLKPSAPFVRHEGLRIIDVKTGDVK
ncbi:YcxB family protein [Agrobacterium rubi]|uniref:YcxB family protein n=1 Tax=Agrobacterium rubi TaxID=28099 RepID=UPI001572E682|nr:YcxB family protein [Agrobacterium rubi]NTF19073.1 YcxB family protein [Agrobacterium rubi]NTF26036.1 YcxB family protein [Agrobacterium rubi]